MTERSQQTNDLVKAGLHFLGRKGALRSRRVGDICQGDRVCIAGLVGHMYEALTIADPLHPHRR